MGAGRGSLSGSVRMRKAAHFKEVKELGMCESFKKWIENVRDERKRLEELRYELETLTSYHDFDGGDDVLLDEAWEGLLKAIETLESVEKIFTEFSGWKNE